MILCCLSLAENFEAELEKTKQKLFQLYALSSARLLPAIIPLALFESRPDSAYNLCNKIQAPPYITTEAAVCTESLIYIEAAEKASLSSLSSKLNPNQTDKDGYLQSIGPVHVLLEARGCFLALNEGGDISREELIKNFPASKRRLRCLSLDLIELRLQSEKEWWRSMEWEIIDRNYIAVKD